MAEDRSPASLEELDSRIRKAREGQSAGDGGPEHGGRSPDGPASLALRVGGELFAAIVVGVGGGILLDRWLGIAPWGLIVLSLLSFTAAFLNIYRTATESEGNGRRARDGGDSAPGRSGGGEN